MQDNETQRGTHTLAHTNSVVTVNGLTYIERKRERDRKGDRC